MTASFQEARERGPCKLYVKHTGEKSEKDSKNEEKKEKRLKKKKRDTNDLYGGHERLASDDRSNFGSDWLLRG